MTASAVLSILESPPGQMLFPGVHWDIFGMPFLEEFGDWSTRRELIIFIMRPLQYLLNPEGSVFSALYNESIWVVLSHKGVGRGHSTCRWWSWTCCSKERPVRLETSGPESSFFFSYFGIAAVLFLRFLALNEPNRVQIQGGGSFCR